MPVVLIKIVQESQQGRSYETKLTTNISEVIAWLNANTFESISLTGGNAGVIAENLNVDATIFVEFDASSKGLGMLLKSKVIILTNIYSLMSVQALRYIISMANNNVVCGYWRYDSGLGYLLSQITDYEDLNLAQSGDRDTIDLKVKHI